MIDVQKLNYTYAGATATAVRDLSFQIAPGEVFGFLGPSGAGKSTTQKVLIGLLRGYDGRVAVMGKDLHEHGPGYFERIGVSFEVPNHYLKLTAVENLTYFASLYSVPARDPRELLALVGLADDGDTLVGQYSKGMKNRLSVARALLNNPDLLFMDEPTAGLDPVNAQRVKDLIRDQQRQGKTIFLTTHDMSVADQLCDRVAFIVDGEVSRVDSPRAFKLQYGDKSVRVEFGENGRTAAELFPLDGLGHNNAFVDLLRHNSIQTIHSQEATLEDVFIKVTGRQLA